LERCSREIEIREIDVTVALLAINKNRVSFFGQKVAISVCRQRCNWCGAGFRDLIRSEDETGLPTAIPVKGVSNRGGTIRDRRCFWFRFKAEIVDVQFQLDEIVDLIDA